MGAGGTARDLEAGFSEVSGPPQSCDAVGALGSAPGLRANGKIWKHPRCWVAWEQAGSPGEEESRDHVSSKGVST